MCFCHIRYTVKMGFKLRDLNWTTKTLYVDADTINTVCVKRVMQLSVIKILWTALEMVVTYYKLMSRKTLICAHAQSYIGLVHIYHRRLK